MLLIVFFKKNDLSSDVACSSFRFVLNFFDTFLRSTDVLRALIFEIVLRDCFWAIDALRDCFAAIFDLIVVETEARMLFIFVCFEAFWAIVIAMKNERLL